MGNFDEGGIVKSRRGGQNAADLIGQKFGRLTVVSCAGSNRHQKKIWLCRCDCGTEITTTTGDLKSGTTRSCTCLQKEVVGALKLSHGQRSCVEYKIWQAVISRCENKKNSSFKYYGGRGIFVHTSFRNSFEAFLKEVGRRPAGSFTIERKDVNKGYEPGNLEWIPHADQAKNKRSNIKITFNGKTKCLAEWGREFGISYGTLTRRMEYGVNPPRLFSKSHLRTAAPLSDKGGI